MHIFEKPDNLVELIENSVEKYPDNAMFGTKNKDGEYEWITYRDVGKRIDNLRGGLSQAGIEKGEFHDLRRTCLTNWLVNGLREFDVMTTAGHASFETTRRFYLAVQVRC